MTIFRIGNQDFSDCIWQNGLHAYKRDFLSPLTRRSQYDGRMYSKVIGTPYVLEVRTCPMTYARYQQFLDAIESDNGEPQITFSAGGNVVPTLKFFITERPAKTKMNGWMESADWVFEEV